MVTGGKIDVGGGVMGGKQEQLVKVGRKKLPVLADMKRRNRSEKRRKK